ncbi:MAG: beta-N-acetylhexosaminidase, partial [Treponema sp.]|nr:beta-N-acetylhexosaminidase [Treponema sp.]
MTEYAIIPQPVSVKYTAGTFYCSGIPRVIFDGNTFENEARVFNAQIAKTLGEEAFAEGGGIHLAKIEGPADGEFYRLEILPDAIRLSAASGTGIFRGLQALRQLFLSEYQGGEITIPCGIIEDKPRFPWRGLMLDCSRNFFTVDFIKNLLDALSLHHISVFHWHLTDDQGWRLLVKRYPLLTEIGSRRYDSRLRRYLGGFYTEEDIREVVSYAAERHIEVVPEVDLPGHTNSVLAAYPGLGCTGGPYRVEERFGIREEVLCAGNDGIFDLAEAVFDTLVELFPSKYVHIGGDEVVFKHWAECPKCQKRLAELGLSETPQLQSWITSRLAGMLDGRGRVAIGWDEILENTEKFPLPENTVVMSWRSEGGGNEAAALGRRVIMSSLTEGCYLDYKHMEHPDEMGQLQVST